MTVYVPESFDTNEQEILRRYFTNLDGPVFALVNLPEVVKGALFARYSRSSKSLRRLFLDEFVSDLDLSGDHSVDATIGLSRAEDLYEKVFVEYGDDRNRYVAISSATGRCAGRVRRWGSARRCSLSHSSIKQSQINAFDVIPLDGVSDS